jgi:serine/threonine-protein kinase RsbW
MQAVECQLAINLKYCEDEIDSFITSCEDVINNFVENKSAAFKLKVAVHELVVNCVEHGYQKNSGNVDFFIERTEDDLICLTVKDYGKGFDFNAFNLNRKNNCLDDIQPRGWGLLIINRLAERLEFNHNNPTGTIVSVYIADQ